MVTTPVEAVGAILAEAHFRRLAKPLTIAGVKIEVADAFVGAGNSPDLVLVGDTVSDQPGRLLSAVEGAGRALDLVASRRPLTLVVVGPRPSSEDLREMARFARVLPVGDAADENTLRNWLAALLPLNLPVVGASGVEVANTELVTEASDPLARDLAAAARTGKDQVAKVLYAAIEAPFSADDEPLDDEADAS